MDVGTALRLSPFVRPSPFLRPWRILRRNSHLGCDVTPPVDSRAARLWAWVAAHLEIVIALAAFALYAVTVYPGVGGVVNYGDSAKFQFLGRILGLSHPPGAPLYLLATFLWSWLPLGVTPAISINLFSAACASGALALVYLAIRRLKVATLPALAAVALLGLTPVFWEFATEAELYGPLTLCVAFFVHRMLVWWQDRRERDLYLLLGGYFASFGVHYLMVLLVPALFWGITRGPWRPAVRLRSLARIAGLGLLAALPLAYFGLRHSTAPYSEAPAVLDAGAYLDYILSRGYQGHMFNGTVQEVLALHPWQERAVFLDQFTGWGLALAGLGLIALVVRRQKGLAAFLLLGIGVPILFVASYNIPDRLGFYLPSLVILTLAAGAGLGAIWDLARVPRRQWTLVAPFVVAPVLVLTAMHGAQGYQALRQILPDDILRDAGTGEVWDIHRLAELAEPESVVLVPWYDYGHREIANYARFTAPDVDARGIRFEWTDDPPRDWTWAQRAFRPDPKTNRIVYAFSTGHRDLLVRAGYRVTRIALQRDNGDTFHVFEARPAVLAK